MDPALRPEAADPESTKVLPELAPDQSDHPEKGVRGSDSRS